MVMYVDSRASSKHPVVLTAHLDPGLSRLQWLVRWFQAISHYVLLAFLWPAFLVVTVIAGFCILFTGRYPRPLFSQGGAKPTLPPQPPTAGPVIPQAPDPAGTWTTA